VALVALWFQLGRLERRRSLAAASARGVETGQPSTQGTNPDGSFVKYAAVPDFTLTDRSGARVSLADLKGKVWLADFIYTTCPDTCPMLSSRFSELQTEVAALNGAGDVRFVSFSVDPEHDTPEVLQGYARHLKAGDHWYFLTGDKAQVTEIARRGFLLGFEKMPDKTINHSTKIALVDRAGNVRRFYDGVGGAEGIEGTPDSMNAKIVADIETLLKEKPQP